MSELHAKPESKLTRSLAYFGKDQLSRLQNTRVTLIGAGAIGTEVAKHLAFLEISELRIIDPDRISASNLNRCVFFHPTDIGKDKATILGHQIQSLAPEMEIDAFVDLLQSESLPETIWDCDVLISAVDNEYARALLNTRWLSLENKPLLIDGAMGNTFVKARIFPPSCSTCLICTWSPHFHERIFSQKIAQTCSEFVEQRRASFPVISPLNSLVAVLMIQECIRWKIDPDSFSAEAYYLKQDLESSELISGRMSSNPQCQELLCRYREESS